MIRKLIPYIFSLVSVIVSLVIFEIGFRLVKPVKISWSDRPKEYVIPEDAPTFQDYPHEAVKPKGVYRIAVVGDSFTFGPYMQFADTFPKRLEWMLNLNKGTPKVEVINYGVPAYSTSHEVPVVKRALEEGADLVIVQVTLNDPEIKPYTPEALFKDKNKFGELELHGKIFEYWTSLAFVLSRIHNTQTHTNYKKKFFDLFEGEKTWKNFTDSMKKIVDATKEKGVPLVSVVFPLYGIPLDDEYPFHPIHKKIKDLLDSYEVKSLDLFKSFEGIPLERIQVIPGKDFHPNEIGHRIAAESIYRWLKREELIPAQFFAVASAPERIGIRRTGGPGMK